MSYLVWQMCRLTLIKFIGRFQPQKDHWKRRQYVSMNNGCQIPVYLLQDGRGHLRRWPLPYNMGTYTGNLASVLLGRNVGFPRLGPALLRTGSGETRRRLVENVLDVKISRPFCVRTHPVPTTTKHTNNEFVVVSRWVRCRRLHYLT